MAVWVFWAIGSIAIGVLLYRAASKPPEDHRDEPLAPGKSATSRLEKPSPPPGGFTGSKVCAECHAAIADSFQRHPMGRSAHVLSRSPNGEFGLPSSSFSPRAGLTYQVENKQGRLVHREIGTDNSGKVVYNQSVEMDIAIGSGRRGYSFLSNRNGTLYVSPVAWYTQKGRWDLSPGYVPFRNPRFERRALAGCLRCHVGRVNSPPNLPNHVATPPFRETSIGCENCHGPGKRHVEFRRAANPQGRDPIVNPSRLPAPRRDSVCNQCHLQGIATILRYGRQPYDFRPGMALTDVFCVLVHDPKLAAGKRSLKAISHSEQMIASACYRGSAAVLSCTSCHDPHSMPANEDRVAYYRRRCQKCHQPEVGGQRAEVGKDQSSEVKDRRSKRAPPTSDLRPPASDLRPPTCGLPLKQRTASQHGNSCIHCHMPRFGASDVPHTTQTDHRILRRPERPGRSAPDGSPPAFGELMIFGDRAANLSDRTRSRARSIFLAQIADDLGNRPAAEAALKRLATVVREAPDDVEALDAAARCAAVLNRPDDAVNYWRQALKAAPNEEHVLDRLSQYLARTNRLQAALDVLDRLIGINQWSADVHFRRSNVLAGLNRLTEALRAAERGIALDPSRPHYHDWLADMYRRMGRTEDGRRAGDTARKLKARQNQEKRTKQP